MRKMFVALLLLTVGATALLTNPMPAGAQASDDFITIKAKMKSKFDGLGGSLGRLHSSAPSSDTAYIGHIHTTAADPGFPNTAPGGALPYHVGRGLAQYTQGSPNDLRNRNGMWTFDDFQTGETDSLQGWWPYRPNYPFGDIPSQADDLRPWWCLDFGNVTNYVINQGAANKRTFGVVGAWHRDPGNTVPGPGTSPVGWDPSDPVATSAMSTTGSFSAWCGLRAHGDLASQDQRGTDAAGAVTGARGGTGNYFNEDAGPMFGGRTPAQGATIKRFPGYNQQWDQMLYHDFFVADGGSVTLSFKYRTRMSTSQSTNPTAITGWFNKDPLTKVANNFISASAGFGPGCGASCPPIDSFMVYVGGPAENGQGTYSNGNALNIYDTKRRWMSEVLRVNGDAYYEMLSVAGNQPALNTDATPSFSATINDAALDAIRALTGNPTNRFRVVFRVKTNRFFDDLVANAYNSEGRGAAVIDDVMLTGATVQGGGAWAASDGNFEASGSIDNDANAAAAWHSTGKPPAIYFHREALDPLTYADICGDPGDPRRRCNMQGGIVKDGDEDNNDQGTAPFDPDATAEMQVNHGVISPAVNFANGGVGSFNAMGIDGAVAQATGDINVRMDEYFGRGDLNRYGALIQYGCQAYPATNAAGVKVWGEPRFGGSGFFNPDVLCFGSSHGNDRQGFYTLALLRTSNTNGIPDSLRIVIHRVTLCASFGVTTDCSAADAYYIDNASLEIIDSAQPSISVDIWQWLNDSFPFNETTAPSAAAFDTTTALIKSGLNVAQPTNNTLAPNVPGDSVAIASFGTGRRVDMIFRIVPGPGNYVTKGNRLSGLRLVPTSATATAAVPSNTSSNFWESYMAENGTFGTPGGHPSIAGAKVWDPNVWNSARCDTSEGNIFPNYTRAIFGVDQTGGGWQSTYHEGDPASVDERKFNNLGILKNRCFLQDTAGVTVDPNIDCDAAGGTYPPPWTAAVPATRTGYPGTPQTREYTKIIPDGMLTPGSSVQYFFRASLVPTPLVFDMCPDTTIIFPQDSESNSDGHRWQQFGVLPDTWKEVQPVPFPGGGLGGACMLYVDNNDRRGNERMWVSVADSIGLTTGARRGSHNGWVSRGDFQYAVTVAGQLQPVNVAANDAVAVRPNYGQAGTVWDMYQVKASESIDTPGGGFGSRLSNRTGIGLLGDGAGNFQRYSRLGPTPEMLREFYRIVLVHTGDLNSGIWGPFDNRSDQDFALVTDFTTTAGGTTQPRGVFLQGSGFVEFCFNEDVGPPSDFLAKLNSIFNVDYSDRSYTNVSGVTTEYVDLLAKNDIIPGGRIYGIGNPCTETNDVLAALPGATVASNYQGDVFTSGVKNVAATKITLLDGFNASALGSRPDGGTVGPGSGGRIDYMYRALSNVFGALCLSWTPIVTAVGDNPLNGNGAKFVNFLGLRSANPVHERNTVIVFGLAKTEPAEVKVYDVAGRLTKTLANRVFKGGEEHRLVWDGTNDAGQPVARGVYFYQVRTPSYQSQKKLTVLAD